MTANPIALFAILLPTLLLTGCSTPEESVKPGINSDFLDPELDVERMVQRFEVESREIAASRDAIADAVGLESGAVVADIGAGTGLFLQPFAEMVGSNGLLYAVDIAPRFVAHMQTRARDLGLSQVRTVLCSERSVNLPANSVDVAFICDVYHHFEYPRSTMASVHSALRSGGTLVVVDINRDPDIRGGWTLEHIRAPKEVFRAEIEEAGFEFVEEVAIDGLINNYFLRFRKR